MPARPTERDRSFASASQRLQEMDGQKIRARGFHSERFPHLDTLQVKNLNDIFAHLLRGEKSDTFEKPEIKEGRELARRLSQLTGEIQKKFARPGLLPNRSKILDPWYTFKFLLLDQPYPLPEESIDSIRKTLDRLDQTIHAQKLPFSVKLTQLEQDLLWMREKLSQLENKMYPGIHEIGSLRQLIYEQYQKQKLAYPQNPEKARTWLKASLELLRDFTQEQARNLCTAYAAFLERITDAKDTPVGLSDIEIMRGLVACGVHADLSRNMLPVMASVLEGHNQATQVISLSQKNPELLFTALTHGLLALKGTVRLYAEPPVLAVNLVFTDKRDYFALSNHLTDYTKSLENDREEGASFPLEQAFMFGGKNIYAPLTIALDEKKTTVVPDIVEHEQSHQEALVDRRTGEVQREKDEKPFRVTFEGSPLTSPLALRMQDLWRKELLDQVQHGTTRSRDETQAYIWHVLFSPDEVAQELSSDPHNELYRYLADEDFIEDQENRIATAPLALKTRSQAINELHRDIEQARKMYAMGVKEAVANGRKIIQVLYNNNIPIAGIRALLRASTVHEWRYIARYIAE